MKEWLQLNLLCEKQACACQKRGTVKGKWLLPYAPLSDPALMHTHTHSVSIFSLTKADLKQKRLGNPLSSPLSSPATRRVQPFWCGCVFTVPTGTHISGELAMLIQAHCTHCNLSAARYLGISMNKARSASLFSTG